MNKELLNIQLSALDPSPYPDRKKGLLFIHDFDFNGNGLKIPEELAQNHLDSLNGSPLVAYYNEYMNDIGGHEEERDLEGNIIALHTDAVGVLFDAHIGTHEINGKDTYGVYAYSYLWLRFANTLNVVENIFKKNGSVDISVEVALGGFEYPEEDSNKRIAKDYLNYFGTALLSTRYNPSYADAGMYALNNLEVATAYKKDMEVKLNSLKLDSEKEVNNEVGGVSMLSYEEKRDQLRALLNPKDNEAGNWTMDYSMYDSYTFEDHIVARSYNDGSYYKISYEVQNDTTVVLVGEPVKVAKIVEFKEIAQGETIEIAEELLFNRMKELEQKTKELSSIVEQKEVELNEVELNEVIKLKEKEIEELNTEKEEQLNKFNQKESEFNSLIEEKTSLENKIKELSTADTELNELQSKVENLQKEINSKEEALNNTKQTTNEEIIKLGLVINELKEQLSQLKPIKEEFDKLQAEKQEVELNEKRNSLKQFALNSKFVEEKEFAENEEIKQAIMEVNEAKIKDIIASRVVEKAIQETDNKINSNNSDVIINAKNPEDLNLLPTSVKEEMFAPVGRK